MSSRISFTGVMINSEVFDRHLQADVFVLPTYREAFGVAYVEAMASGLLTIGVEGQGPSQFIENGRTGLLMKLHSVGSIDSRLSKVLSHPDRNWRCIAAVGANLARQACTLDAHAERLLEVFHESKSEVRATLVVAGTTLR